MDKNTKAILWALGGAALVGGIAYAMHKSRQLPSGTQANATPTTGQQTGTNAPPGLVMDEAWRQRTLAALRANLDRLGWRAEDDQFWRGVHYLVSRDQNFVVPSSLDQFNALRFVADKVAQWTR